MIKHRRKNKGRRILSLIAAGLLLACLFSGCKIEFPDELSAELNSGAGAAEEAGGAGFAGTDSLSSVGETASAESTAPNQDGSSGSVSSKQAQAESEGDRDRDNASSKADENSSRVTSKPELPAPVEPEDAVVDKKKTYTCTMSITCKKILENMELLKPNKKPILEKYSDGVIYAERKVTFYEGESVFDVLSREVKRNRIHMEFESFPLYNSHYIEGIANLYEFDCGEGSGWMYQVNGVFPNYGCSRYQLKDGDRIDWVFTCDLGFDIGAELGGVQGK